VLILSPVDRVSEVPELVDAGAGELYAGYVPPFWTDVFGPVVSCNRRSFDEANVGSFDDLGALVHAAAVRDVPVHVALNASPIPDGMIPRMVETAVDLARIGVRGVIVSDLSFLLALRAANLPRLALHASTLFSAFNGMTVAFLRRAGAERVVLARELSTAEIAAIVRPAGETRIETIGFRGRCPNIEGFCTHLHDDPRRTWPCGLRYEKEWVGQGEAIPPEVLAAIERNEGADRFFSCGLCAVPLLERAGVHAIKIVGRGSETARKVDAVRTVAAMRAYGREAIPVPADCSARGHALYRETFGRPCRPENCYFPEFHSTRDAGFLAGGFHSATACRPSMASSPAPPLAPDASSPMPMEGQVPREPRMAGAAAALQTPQRGTPRYVTPAIVRSVYQYLGPEGEGIAGLPDGVGAAMGSEYCVHLLPSPATMTEAVREAADRGAKLLLLTPYFRDAELKTFLPLFRAIPADAPVDVAVNDWGALRALHGLFPRMRLSIGRLLSGQKRCPRIGVSAHLTEEGRMWHGGGIFSSPSAVSFLAEAYGVAGYHIDDLPWSLPALDANVVRDAEAPFLFVHAPHAIVSVSDACPWIGGASSASIASCPRPCRNDHVILREPSMGGDLFQKGKARFTTRDSGKTGRPAPSGAVAVVTYPGLP
jgi:putative protease